MKNIILLFSLSIFISSNSFAHFGDTTIRGVPVVFRYSVENFPLSWRTAEIDAMGKPIALQEIDRTKIAIAKAINKYPLAVLAENLKGVYFFREIQFYHTGFGGTNSQDRLYLTNDGISSGYSNDYIEQTFHHEFSSILFREHAALFDEAAWAIANKPGFVYNDPLNGVGAIQKGEDSQTIDTLLCKKGILTTYAMSSLENDLNTIAQNIFCPAESFWKAVDTYPRIKLKVLLLISFYNKLDPLYTETFFRRLDTKNK